MENTLLNMLETIFFDYEDYVTTSNGNAIIVKLDDDRRVKVMLYETWCHDCYDAIKMSVVSKTHGVIDTCVSKFSNIFEYAQDMNHPNKIGKHIWKRDVTGYDWYGKPTRQDIEMLNAEIVRYISAWE